MTDGVAYLSVGLGDQNCHILTGRQDDTKLI